MDLKLQLGFLKPRNREPIYIAAERSSGSDLEEIIQKLTEMKPTAYKRKTVDSWQIVKSLGHGNSGHVDLMKDREENFYAVKKMLRTGRSEKDTQIKRELQSIMKTWDLSIEYIIRFIGYMISDYEIWVMMEVMDTCFGKLLDLLGEKESIPEHVIGSLSASVVKALHHLKSKHKMIHRDVRPTNILVDRNGSIKLCDFGISRTLVNSTAFSVDAGNKFYLAPERLTSRRNNYNIKSDVWSLGITLIELATGRNPYYDCKSEFAATERIITEPPPSLPEGFSPEFKDFVASCLQKDPDNRPDYEKLMRMEFFRKYDKANPSLVAKWIKHVLNL